MYMVSFYQPITIAGEIREKFELLKAPCTLGRNSDLPKVWWFFRRLW